MAKTDEDIIVCRCEDVTLGDIRKAIREGATTMDEIKRITRAGMGPCQGKTCRLLVAAELAKHLGKPISEIIPSTYRPPTKAVKLGDLAKMEDDREKHPGNDEDVQNEESDPEDGVGSHKWSDGKVMEP